MTMIRLRRGFTMIEVSLFLAITGALFIAVTAGVQNSIAQQRYNDSVQNFVEFLRSAYAETMNVQSADNGRSEQAIYGKLVTFGESQGLEGNDSKGGGGNRIFVYDVIGDAEGNVGNQVISALIGVGANVIVANNDGSAVAPAGIVESYLPRWASSIEPACSDAACEYEPIKAAVLVVRHPRSGTVYTYTMNGRTVEVNEAISRANDQVRSGNSAEDAAVNNNPLKKILEEKTGGFEMKQLDFCLNPYAGEVNTTRADIRLPEGARNSSAIQVIADFSVEGGNKCLR